ncbi:MAG: hypothetical protein AB1591_10635 [Pseudomonadota bacterium]
MSDPIYSFTVALTPFTLMAGLGLAKLFAEVDVIPVQLRFENYGIVFVVVGFALTVPALFHIIKTARAKKPA